MARVKLLQTREDVSPEHHALFDELAALRGRISGPSSIVLHSPGLARPWNEVSEFLHRRSVVEAEAAELAVCATSRHFDCGYVWGAHLPNARAAGVSDATLDAVARDGPLDGLSSSEVAVVEYVRQLLGGRRVDRLAFDALLAGRDPQWLVELTAWIGRYAALSLLLNAFEVETPLERDVLPVRGALEDTATGIRMPESESRVPLLRDRTQVPPSAHPVFDAVAEGRGNVRGPFALLLHSPELCQIILALSVYFREDNFVPAETRELAVTATARERDCPYVWAAHAPAARKEGVDDAIVAAVRERDVLPDAASDAQRDVVEYVRQLLRHHHVDQALFDRMLAAHTLPGLVELTCVIGHYVFVTTLLNAFEISPAPDAEVLPLA